MTLADDPRLAHFCRSCKRFVATTDHLCPGAVVAAATVMTRARAIACSLEEGLIERADVFRLLPTLGRQR